MNSQHVKCLQLTDRQKKLHHNSTHLKCKRHWSNVDFSVDTQIRNSTSVQCFCLSFTYMTLQYEHSMCTLLTNIKFISTGTCLKTGKKNQSETPIHLVSKACKNNFFICRQSIYILCIYLYISARLNTSLSLQNRTLLLYTSNV